MADRLKTIQASELFDGPIEGTVDIPEPEEVEDWKIAEEMQRFREYQQQLVVRDPTRTIYLQPPPTIETPQEVVRIVREAQKEEKKPFLMRMGNSIMSFFNGKDNHFEKNERDNYEK